jgi:addiction module HigA family antidote
MKQMTRTKEYRVTGRPSSTPVHPGEILREDVLPALGMSVAEAARELRVSRQTLHRILSATMAVSPEMAVRLGKFCGNGAGLWSRLQSAYDLWHAEEQLRDEIKRIPNRRAA